MCRSRHIFYCRTLEDIDRLVPVIAALFPDPQRVQLGVIELLVNAVEHGNLGIGYALKTHLMREGGWHEEIARRFGLPRQAHKYVEIVVSYHTDGVCLQVTDSGAGFHWPAFLHSEPGGSRRSHGRGIALARRFSFDHLRYNARGNQASAWVYTARYRRD